MKPINPLNWDDLRYFVAVVDAGTVSQAARSLEVEHTTVARRIDALEASLEVKLFDRFPKAWSLTDDGTQLVPVARQVEDSVLALVRSASSVAGLDGNVCISGPPLLISHFLIPLMQESMLRLPSISFEFIGETKDANLVRREADIALRLQRPTAPSVTAKLLATIEFGLYGTRQYIDTTPEPEWVFIAYNESLAHTPQQQWLEEVANGRRIAFRANEMYALLQGARSGLGLAALPHYLAKNEPGLVCVKSQDSSERKLWLVMHDDVRRSPRVRAVADELIRLFSEQVNADGNL